MSLKHFLERYKLKILLLDIENAPHLAHVWRLWDQNVPLSHLLDSAYILCWAAKWYGDPEVFFDSLPSGKKTMLRGIHKLLSEADAVVHYNGNRHDIPMLNREFLETGMFPPSPAKQIDLIETVKTRFKFPSNKLEYVVKALGLGEKVAHEGHTLWIKTMQNDPDAWERMMEYNVNDVMLLEDLYVRLLPWIRNHPNVGVYHSEHLVCTGCGSRNYIRRGTAVTRDNYYQRFQCKDCGSWFRATKPRLPKPGEKFSAI